MAWTGTSQQRSSTPCNGARRLCVLASVKSSSAQAAKIVATQVQRVHPLMMSTLRSAIVQDPVQRVDLQTKSKHVLHKKMLVVEQVWISI